MKAIHALSNIFNQLTAGSTKSTTATPLPRVPTPPTTTVGSSHPASLQRVPNSPIPTPDLTHTAPPPRVTAPAGPHIISPDNDVELRYNLQSRTCNIQSVPRNPHAYQVPMTFTGAAMPNYTSTFKSCQIRTEPALIT